MMWMYAMLLVGPDRADGSRHDQIRVGVGRFAAISTNALLRICAP